MWCEWGSEDGLDGEGGEEGRGGRGGGAGLRKLRSNRFRSFSKEIRVDKRAGSMRFGRRGKGEWAGKAQGEAVCVLLGFGKKCQLCVCHMAKALRRKETTTKERRKEKQVEMVQRKSKSCCGVDVEEASRRTIRVKS